jgi:Transcription factor WhiB
MQPILVHRLGHLVGGVDDVQFASGARPAEVWWDGEGAGWRLRARCRGMDPSAFVPRREAAEVPGWVAEVCGPCPVREACRRVAVASRSVGYWAASRTKMGRGRG